MKFELVQPGEFADYYYEISSDDDRVYGTIEYDGGEWILERLYYVDSYEMIQISNKINQLNAATKADKLFGFL